MNRLIALVVLATTIPANAATFQDNTALDRAVAAFTGQAVGALGGARARVDARLKLASCPTLSLAWRTPAQDAVTIICTGPEWRIFVPVIMPATVPTASAAAIAASAPVAPVPPVIRRGDPVTVEASDGGFSISREGVAMGDAAPGARFLVKVDGGKTPVQATAIAAGRATLPGWSQ